MKLLAFTHLPSPQLQSGERTFVPDEQIDHPLALRQHEDYCQALRRCGADVKVLDVNRHWPDSVFIEDTAVVLDEVAVMAAPGAASRQAEPEGIAAALREFRELARIERGTLDGGDVLRVGRTLLVGQSRRTSAEGVESLAGIVGRYGYRVVPVPVHGCLHLKTACTALPDGRLLVNPAWIDLTALSGYALIHIPAAEPWSANLLPLGGRILISAAHARMAELIVGLGFGVDLVDVSEFAKAEGGMTCLSILLYST